MRCQVIECQRKARHQVGINIPDTATEIFRLLVPAKTHLCDEHFELCKASGSGPYSLKKVQPPANRS